MSKDLSARYYKKNQRKASKKAHESYQDLYEEEKSKKQKCGRERYKNLPEDKKQRLAEYRKNIINYGKIRQLQK